MSKGTLPFSDTDYSKLKYAVFPTIRRRDKYGSVGDVNEVVHGERGSRRKIGEAEIIAKETKTFQEMTDSFLCHDTESDTVEESYRSINKFYRKAIEPNEELTIYWNKWVDHE